MVTKEDVQNMIDRLEGGTVESREVEPGFWVVKSQHGAEIVVNFAPPVVILRVRVMEPPVESGRRSDFYRQLLEFNAHDLVHGSYGLEGEHVVLTDALELGHLDFEEFEATFDSLTLALKSHMSALAPYRER